MDWWSLIGGGSLREVAVHGDSTVYGFKTPSYKEIKGQLDKIQKLSPAVQILGTDRRGLIREGKMGGRPSLLNNTCR